jgi:hypothetical protein
VLYCLPSTVTVILISLRHCFAQRLKPEAQSLALINRLPLWQAQHLPPDHASQYHQQDAERDVDPLSHGGIMSRMRRKSSKFAALPVMAGRASSSAGAISTDAAGISERLMRTRMSGGVGAGCLIGRYTTAEWSR